MRDSPDVLLYGTDSHLTETRRLVLDRAGFQVHIAVNLVGFEAAGQSRPPDVVVLCHTLVEEECDAALAIAQRDWPEARRLVLTAGDRGCWRPDTSAAVDATDGPRKLIQTVRQLAVAGSSAYSRAVQAG